jgi:DNA invertase Pin-like site-specific DNA recombinase
MKAAIYCRVSTQLQDLVAQVATCKKYCEYQGLEVGHIFQEKVSGMKAKRPEYGALLKALRSGEYQAVVVFRIDRLGRNSRELALTIDELEGRHIKICSVTENFDTSTPLGRAMREFNYILVQLERDNIAEATRLRLASIKASGKRLGRPPGAKDKAGRRKSGYLLRYANKRPGKNDTETTYAKPEGK